MALLEAAGTVASRKPSLDHRRGAGASRRASSEYKVAELYLERRGSRSIVGNIYKGRVDNVLAGLEAAFVDIGLEKNGFLHVDEIVLPGVEAPRRGRGGGRDGRNITDMLKPGQEIVVQVVKDPLKTKGARLSMDLTIAGRYMVYAPYGEGVGVSRRLDDKERERLRKEAAKLDLKGAGAIIRTAAQGAKRADLERELVYLFKLGEVLREARRRDPGARARLPGGRSLGPRRARHLLRRLRARRGRRSQAAPPARVLLQPDRARAGRAGRAVGGRHAAVRGLRGRGGAGLDAVAAGGPPQRRLSDDRLRRGAHGDRRQLRLVHRARQGRAPGGHDHQDQPRGRRRGRAPAAAARHRRDHRHRLHRHGAGPQPRRRPQDAAQGAGRGPDQDLRRRDLAARARRDDAPERDRRGPRDHDPAVPHL